MVSVAKDAAKNEIASFSAKASKLKHEGDVFFVQKRVGEALVSYEKALRLSLSGSEEKAALHANRAACYLMQNKLSLAVSEATAALENAPTWKPALMRRAKALEQIGHNEKAAADYERAFRIDGNEETRRKMITAKTNAAKEKEKSKKELRGLGPGSGLTGGANRRPVDRRAALLAQQQAAQQQRQLEQRNAPTLTLAVTFDGSLKNFTVPLASVTYLQILAAAKSAFTEKLGDNEHIALKFLDPEGTLVTVTSRSDLRYALAASQSLAARTAAASGAPQAAPDSLVPVRLEVVVVDRTPSETPDQITPANVGSPDSSPSDGDPPAEDVIEIDEWLLTFAALFRKHLGVARETSGPLDLRVVGLEKCCEALEEAVGTDEAKGLLKSAAEKFQEAAAAAVFNWGNVHVCASRKLVDTSEPAEISGAGGEQNAPSEAALKTAATRHMARIDLEFESAVARYVQALAIKPDFYEASIAWGQQAFERGKVTHVASKEPFDASLALETDKMFALSLEKFAESLGMIPTEETVSTSETGDQDNAQASVPEEGLSLKSQILVLWGNVLFERSQVKHHRDPSIDGAWRLDCVDAVKKFTDAGCVTGDIVRALMNHTSGVWAEEKDAAAAAAAGGK